MRDKILFATFGFTLRKVSVYCPGWKASGNLSCRKVTHLLDGALHSTDESEHMIWDCTSRALPYVLYAIYDVLKI